MIKLIKNNMLSISIKNAKKLNSIFAPSKPIEAWRMQRKTPDEVLKEIAVHFLAYNIILGKFGARLHACIIKLHANLDSSRRCS
jgi:hypothetical protein